MAITLFLNKSLDPDMQSFQVARSSKSYLTIIRMILQILSSDTSDGSNSMSNKILQSKKKKKEEEGKTWEGTSVHVDSGDPNRPNIPHKIRAWRGGIDDYTLYRPNVVAFKQEPGYRSRINK
ncbi:hypothetical protein PGT21_028408 [Puccinia graminis f. sp. tritici]|uniref:Uncharacterized protein n=1 Tax=Puccinia graminis f. sp. tritici TaxID=56615 RepID=A0A5B0Q6Q5_PUCGR|nr:hypothetical protein PGT21_028408 [Puccinia graminis f. sp. tritici]